MSTEIQENARLVPIEQLRGWERNPRTITPDRLEQLKRALRSAPLMLWVRPLAALPDGRVILGNQRLRAIAEMRAAGEMGWETVPVVTVDLDEQTAAEWAIRDNNEYGVWQEEELAALLREMQKGGSDLDLTGFDEGELARLLGDLERTAEPRPDRPSLADRFVVPPFSVLDQRAGYWQERRRRWLDVGIQSEIGRAAKIGGLVAGATGHGHLPQILGSASGRDPSYYDQKMAAEAQLGRSLPAAEFEASGLYVPQDGAGGLTTTGTSVFDPVLCELAYRWFSPPNGRVLDPFAGGSVRGIVASLLGRWYVGVDLSEQQVEANRQQANEILSDDADRAPRWIVGDLDLTVTELDDEVFDLVFTCPPYYDLERYSDDERDLSTMSTAEFRSAYARILKAATDLLAPDSFAVIVVSDVRDRAGMYRPLADTTTEIMAGLGLGLYNRAMLVNPVGSLPVRVARQFTMARKLGRTHQDVLVYVKGDPRRAAARCGQVDVTLDEVLPAGIVDAIVAAPDEDTVRVKISAANCRQRFHGCEKSYIETVCKGRCCRSSSDPRGFVISVGPGETLPRLKFEEIGRGVDEDGLVRGIPGRKSCPAQTDTGLCSLHGEPSKPLGCQASPFTLTDRDTLIVRNRFRRLVCFNDHRDGEAPMAYQCFRQSLDALFGVEQATLLSDHLDAGGGDMYLRMDRDIHALLHDKNRASRLAVNR